MYYESGDNEPEQTAPEPQRVSASASQVLSRDIDHITS